MEHPYITVKNASLYYDRMLDEAENQRLAKKLTGSRPKNNILLAMMKRLPALNGKSVERPMSSAA